MEKISFNKTTIKGQAAYDIKLQDKSLTIQEYLNAMNEFIVSGRLERLWPGKCDDCCGCDLCCHEPLPLTSIDVMSIGRTTNTDLIEVFRYLWVEAIGGQVDITLRRGLKQACIFLNPNGTCSIYLNRPFTCQTYICCQTSQAVEELRSQVVNLGMDELVRSSILAFRSRGLALPVNRSQQAHTRASDWPETCFTGKNHYSEIYLQDVLSPDLLRRLL